MAATDPSNSLAALTLAALALPGTSPKAETPPPAAGLDFNYSRYEESDNRMRVEAYQMTGILPVGDRLSFKVDGVKDVVSGASPAFNAITPDGRLVQVRSGATIQDERDAVTVNASYFLDDAALGVNVGTSSENDYASDYFSLDTRWELNQKMTTLAASFGYASDQVWRALHPPGGGIYHAPGIGGDKFNRQGMLGVTQVLDKHSLLQANLTYANSDGYLSDPYKKAQVGFRLVDDNRPGHRQQFGVLLRYVRSFEELNAAALHLDYRFYSDSWGIDAHTFEVSWYQPVLPGWLMVPRFRYYTQNAADFYQPVFNAPSSDGFYSSDYRMASFGDISGGVQLLTKEYLDHLRFAASIDFYKRKLSYGWSAPNGTALDDFSYSQYSLSLNLTF